MRERPSVISALWGGESGGTGRTIQFSVFSRDEATLYEGVSVRWSVCNQFFFGLLGATYAVYTALLFCKPQNTAF